MVGHDGDESHGKICKKITFNIQAKLVPSGGICNSCTKWKKITTSENWLLAWYDIGGFNPFEQYGSKLESSPSRGEKMFETTT